MEAIRIQTHLDSDTLYLPDLKPMIGKDVEIIILAESRAEKRHAVEIRKRQPGSAKGLFSMSDDFEAPLEPEIIGSFYR